MHEVPQLPSVLHSFHSWIVFHCVGVHNVYLSVDGHLGLFPLVD